MANSWTRPWLPWSAVKVRTGVPSRLLLASAAAVGLVLLAAPLVGAQDDVENSLSSTEPADGDTLSTSPTQLVFTFTRELGADHALTRARLV